MVGAASAIEKYGTFDWLDSVYSDGSSFFVSNPKPKKGDTVEISLQVRADAELTAVLLRSREYGTEHLYEMERRDSDHGIARYTASIKVNEHLFRYQFYLVADGRIFYYTQYCITDYIPPEHDDFCLVIDSSMPEWTKNAVFYQIFPDRFSCARPDLSVRDNAYSYRGHPVRHIPDWNTPAGWYEDTRCLDFYGGDLYGVIDKLDYLEELGVSAIYLNPIFQAPSIHRYDALDFDQVCPILGGNEALAALTAAMHVRGMHLMLDISVNHVSSDSAWFNRDAVFYPADTGAFHNPEAPERQYFFFSKENDYVKWAGVETMPTLNYTSHALRRRIYKDDDAILKKWLLPPYSIDAWRFDVADAFARNEHADLYKEIWSDIHAELKRVKPDILLLAEEWTDCSNMLQGGPWDSVMNYFGFARPVREFLGETDPYHARNPILAEVNTKMTARQLKKRIEQFYARLPHTVSAALLNHLDTHDLTRIHTNPDVHPDEHTGAVLLMFTLPGMPSIYYGDERLLSGRHTDIEGARYPMDWSSLKDASETVQSHADLYRRLAHLKRTSPVLSDGGFKIVYAEGRVLASARFTPDELLLTVISGEPAARTIRIAIGNLGFRSASRLETLVGPANDAVIDGEQLTITVPAHQSYLMRIRH